MKEYMVYVEAIYRDAFVVTADSEEVATAEAKERFNEMCKVLHESDVEDFDDIHVYEIEEAVWL